MTNREAYVFGWVFGRISREGEGRRIDLERGILEPSARPYSANAQILVAAHRERVMNADLDAQIGEALCEIDHIEPPMEGGSEKYQPLQTQGQWMFGYYAGLAKHPLGGNSQDIIGPV